MIGLLILLWIFEPAVRAGCPEKVKGDFPIERYYSNVKIGLSDRGPTFSRGSKAFALWRQKTPPHIEDSAFAFHYMKDEQKLAAARIVARGQRAQELRPVPAGETLSPSGLIRLVESGAQEDWSHLRWIVSRDRQGRFDALFFFDLDHVSVAQAIRSVNSGLDPISGGTLDISLVRWNDGFRIESLTHIENWAAVKSGPVDGDESDSALRALIGAIRPATVPEAFVEFLPSFQTHILTNRVGETWRLNDLVRLLATVH